MRADGNADPRPALQEFVYAVSHDFGRPLRHITAFSELLQDKHRADFDDESNEWMSYLIRAGKEAGLMLERLLGFSRVASQELILAEVDLAEACRTAIDAVKSRYPDHGKIINVQAAGRFTTDPELFGLLLAELVENAVLYGGDLIAIDADADNRALRLAIGDDGAGIPDEQLASALRPFGRLQPEDPAHVGLGLNYCKRILERLGADLTVEGARFSFELAPLD